MFTVKLLKGIHKRDTAIRMLKKQIKNLNQMLVARSNNKYVRRFNNEMAAEYLTNNPECDVVMRIPDANEIYKRYYELKDSVGR